ncbi:hypothetical protein B0H34DRAFT_426517 [Crassisporium funariophilum]|nr:hypothetical protein B0H34DRAFT_426517 [Crassisporium funariophilum]
MVYTFFALLTVVSNFLVVSSQTTTVLPMPFQWEDQPVVADIIGQDTLGRTTYELHDGAYDATFSKQNGLLGTVTYVLGSDYASIYYVAGETPPITAIGECVLAGNKVGDLSTCTLSMDGSVYTSTQAIMAATVTIGSVAPGAPTPTPNSSPNTPTPKSTPGPSLTTTATGGTALQTNQTGASSMNVVSTLAILSSVSLLLSLTS